MSLSMEPFSAAVETLMRRPLRHGFDWRVTGLEHIPERGAVLLAANHVSLLDPPPPPAGGSFSRPPTPTSLLAPPLLASVADRRHRRVRFMAMAELFRSPVPR